MQAKYLGILNITPDSFSDGDERYIDSAWLIKRAELLMQQGFHAIDVGAESTRPNASELSADEEYGRLENFLKLFCSLYKFPLSIDTRKYEVMQEILSNKAFSENVCFLNDVEAFTDERKIELLRKYDTNQRIKCIVMHSKGGIPPSLKSTEISENFYLEEYPDFSCEEEAFRYDVFNFFSERINSFKSFNIDESRIILDLGLGFGKNLKHSFTLIDFIPDLIQHFKTEILIGASRKSFLKAAVEENYIKAASDASTQSLDEATRKYNLKCLEAGATLFRVHDKR